MKLSEIAGKKIINIYDGYMLGMAGEGDFLVNPLSGDIYAIILPRFKRVSAFPSAKKDFSIPWESVRRIGPEFIVIDFAHED
jgi:YlmC/YmxH family sporulation protein